MNAPLDFRPPELPSTQKLAKTTGLALVIATGLLITIVLPAEYGVDPLRTGAALGLTQLSMPTPISADVVAPSVAQALAPELKGPIAYYPAEYKLDSIQFVLAPYQFMEYKYHLEKGATMSFSWTADAALLHDFHGDPDGGGPNSTASYDKQNRQRAYGTFTAPFSGIHGWYWENPGGKAMTISLMSAGFYTAAVEFRSDRTRHKHELKSLDSVTHSRPQ